MGATETTAVDHVDDEVDAIRQLTLPAAVLKLSAYQSRLERIEHNPSQASVAARLRLLMDIVYDHIESLDT